MAPLVSSDTVQALAFVGALVGGALLLTRTYAPRNAGSSSTKVRNIFLWLAFDALCHMILEASWLYLSTGGRTVRASDSFFAKLWKDYGRADRRWDWADPTVVALELLTVLGDGPIAAYCCYLLVKNDGAYHYWVTVLSVAELYGGWVSRGTRLIRIFTQVSDTSSFPLFADDVLPRMADRKQVPRRAFRLFALLRLPLLYEPVSMPDFSRLISNVEIDQDRVGKLTHYLLYTLVSISSISSLPPLRLITFSPVALGNKRPTFAGPRALNSTTKKKRLGLHPALPHVRQLQGHRRRRQGRLHTRAHRARRRSGAAPLAEEAQVKKDRCTSAGSMY